MPRSEYELAFRTGKIFKNKCLGCVLNRGAFCLLDSNVSDPNSIRCHSATGYALAHKITGEPEWAEKLVYQARVADLAEHNSKLPEEEHDKFLLSMLPATKEHHKNK